MWVCCLGYKHHIGNNMITLQDFCHDLNTLLINTPVDDYCPNGLQVEGQKSITKIGTAVSASLATIQEAVRQNVHALIVHHGMFWERDSQLIIGVKREKLRLLLDNGISLLGYHLPLDIHQEYGNNWKAARDMGWQELQPFGFYKGTAIGVRGILRDTSREKLQEILEVYYQHPANVALGGKKEIKSLALISGGAHKMINDAVVGKVDAFITGSFDEPIWNIAHEEGINFYALGHSATEKVGPKAIGDYLASKFGLEHTFIDVPNPF